MWIEEYQLTPLVFADYGIRISLHWCPKTQEIGTDAYCDCRMRGNIMGIENLEVKTKRAQNALLR